jgi:hypothetical protein
MKHATPMSIANLKVTSWQLSVLPLSAEEEKSPFACEKRVGTFSTTLVFPGPSSSAESACVARAIGIAFVGLVDVDRQGHPRASATA